jgi:hypothetical protein
MSRNLAPVYTLFRSTLPLSFHARMVARLRAQRLGDGAPHEAVPDDLLREDPAVRQAVQGLLGTAAVPDACRHVHVNSRAEPGPWHVDDYCGEPWPEDARFAILCYFPQDTPAEMGPTAIRVDGREVLGAGPAGTYLLMRQDIEHRSTANTSGRERFMLKYLFRVPTSCLDGEP